MNDGADRDQSMLIYGGFALSVAVTITLCQPWNQFDHFMIGAPFGRDFVNFWLGGRLAIEGRLSLLVDFEAYNDLIAQTFVHSRRDWLNFSYPPNILPFLVPFGALPYLTALLAWTALNIGLLVAATRLLTPSRWLAIVVCLAPATTVMVTYGHFGGVLAFLATFAAMRAQNRPMLAGLCLALMSVKPQFAAVLGLILLLSGGWRAVAWSVPVATGVIGLSILAFGIAPWTSYLAVTAPFQTRLLTVFEPDLLRNTLSLFVAARLLGLSLATAQVVQCVFGVAVLAAIVVLVRRDGLNPRTLTVTLLAMMAALPYFQHYDLAIAAPALTVALFARQEAAIPPFLPPLPAVLLWLGPPFDIAFGLTYWPAIQAVVACALTLALFRLLRDRGAAGAGKSADLETA